MTYSNKSTVKTPDDLYNHLLHRFTQLAIADKQNNTHHVIEEAHSISIDVQHLKDSGFRHALVKVIIDTLPDIAHHTPKAVGGLGHILEILTRRHPVMRNKFIKDTANLFEPIAYINADAASDLAHCVILHACSSLTCIRKAAPEAMVALAHMGMATPYKAARMVNDLNIMLERLSIPVNTDDTKQAAPRTVKKREAGQIALMIVKMGEESFDKLSSNNVKSLVGGALISFCDKFLGTVPELDLYAERIQAKTPVFIQDEPTPPAALVTATLFTQPKGPNG